MLGFSFRVSRKGMVRVGNARPLCFIDISRVLINRIFVLLLNQICLHYFETWSRYAFAPSVFLFYPTGAR